MSDKLEKAVKEASADGRLSCKKAFEIADRLGAPFIEVGKAADALDIKIAACQLGCFK